MKDFALLIKNVDDTFWYIFSFLILSIAVYLFFYLKPNFSKKIGFFIDFLSEKFYKQEFNRSKRTLKQNTMEKSHKK